MKIVLLWFNLSNPT